MLSVFYANINFNPVQYKVRVPNFGQFLIWDKAIFQGTLSCISTVYTAHTQHHLWYLHTECLAWEDSGNPFADIEVL